MNAFIYEGDNPSAVFFFLVMPSTLIKLKQFFSEELFILTYFNIPETEGNL